MQHPNRPDPRSKPPRIPRRQPPSAARIGAGLATLTFFVLAAGWGLGRVPLWLPAVAGLAAFAWNTVGVIFPTLRMHGNPLSFGPEHTLHPRVALTFDDGPDPRHTPRILDALREAQARATFFVLGEKAERHPDLIRRIVLEGHELAVHGYTHHRLYAAFPRAIVRRDLTKMQELLSSLCPNVALRCFRPPMNFASAATFAATREAGLQLVAYSLRSFDAVPGMTPASVLSRILRLLHPGAIVLMHDAPETEGGSWEPPAVHFLPQLLRELQKQNYAVVTLSELTAPPADG